MITSINRLLMGVLLIVGFFAISPWVNHLQRYAASERAGLLQTKQMDFVKKSIEDAGELTGSLAESGKEMMASSVAVVKDSADSLGESAVEAIEEGKNIAATGTQLAANAADSVIEDAEKGIEAAEAGIAKSVTAVRDTIEKSATVVEDEANKARTAGEELLNESEADLKEDTAQMAKNIENQAKETEQKVTENTATERASLKREPLAEDVAVSASEEDVRTVVSDLLGIKLAETKLANLSAEQQTALFKKIPVHFEYATANLSEESKIRADVIASVIVAQPGRQFMITGHTDDRGNSKENQRLAMQRARTLKDILVKKGVSSEVVQLQAMGAEQAIASNKTALGRWKNRRATISLVR